MASPDCVARWAKRLDIPSRFDEFGDAESLFFVVGFWLRFLPRPTSLLCRVNGFRIPSRCLVRNGNACGCPYLSPGPQSPDVLGVRFNAAAVTVTSLTIQILIAVDGFDDAAPTHRLARCSSERNQISLMCSGVKRGDLRLWCYVLRRASVCGY